MLELIDHWRSLEQRSIDASNKRLATFRARGQLSPRERLEHLLDPGMPFIQLHSMANFCVEDSNRETSVPGASVIVGIGFVEGVRCMIWVDDSGISAGAATETTGLVSTSILEICMRQKLPLIHLVESAGANLLKYQVELWSRFGNVFRELARLSAAGIPTMVVFTAVQLRVGLTCQGCPTTLSASRITAWCTGRCPLVKRLLERRRMTVNWRYRDARSGVWCGRVSG